MGLYVLYCELQLNGYNARESVVRIVVYTSGLVDRQSVHGRFMDKHEFNSSPPSAAYMRQWQNFSFTKMHLKMSSAKNHGHFVQGKMS